MRNGYKAWEAVEAIQPMTQLEKAREEILNWHIAHNSHPQEWNYYRRELKRVKIDR